MLILSSVLNLVKKLCFLIIYLSDILRILKAFIQNVRFSAGDTQNILSRALLKENSRLLSSDVFKFSASKAYTSIGTDMDSSKWIETFKSSIWPNLEYIVLNDA